MVLEKCVGELPEGCKMCRQGSKMVLLVSGLCGRRCYYCPLSLEKTGKDVVYVNEGRVRDPKLDAKKILDEARDMVATGTGITGGDPMMVPGRTIDYISMLKDNFGEEHHVHLYTAGHFEVGLVKELAQVGLDEIRFHPPVPIWGKLPGSQLEEVIDKALDTEIDVGIEIPAIPLPKVKEDTMTMLKFLDNLGVLFVNLNELEYSESNYEALNSKGFEVKEDISSAVKGSEELALEIIDGGDLDLTVHYCSSSFKDRVQLRKRMQRRAQNIKRPLEIFTDDDTFVLGVIDCRQNLMRTREELRAEFDIPEDLIHINIDRKRIEVAPWILEEIADDLEFPSFIIEEYPTIDRLEVERRPLN